MYRTSISTEEIVTYLIDWPKDQFCVRQVNRTDGMHWAVCDTKTWNIITLSYTEEEAHKILDRFKELARAVRSRRSISRTTTGSSWPTT